MPESIQGLQFEISTKTSDSALNKNLDATIRRLKTLGTSGEKTATGLRTLSNALSGIQIDNKKVKGITALCNALNSLDGVRISKKIGDSIEAIGKSLQTITNEDISKVKELSNALKQMDGITVPNIGKTMSQIPKETETPVVKDVSAESSDVAPVMEDVSESISHVSVASEEASEKVSLFRKVLNGLQTIGAKAATAMKSFTSSLASTAVSPVKRFTSGLGTLFASLKRIAFYRAIRFFFSQLSKALKEGITNLYEYSKVMGGTFKGAMDSVATSFLYLKNSMGAMVAPLIESLAPAIEYIIDKFVGLLNIVNQFFAALTGSKTYTVAKRVATTFKDSADSANKTAGDVSKSAKELKRSILGFDEINALNPNKNAGSGSGGGSGSSGSSSPDYGSMFETKEISSNVVDWVNDIKKAIEDGDWEGLGRLIGNKVNEAVNSVDWYGLGKEIGTKFAGAVQTLYTALDTIDFKKIGKHLGELINGITENVDFTTFGRLVVKPFTSLGDLIIGALEEINWKEIGASISESLTGAFREIGDFFAKYDWHQIGLDFYNAIEGVFTGIKWGDLASAVWSAIWGAIKAAGGITTGILDGLANSINSGLKGLDSKINNDLVPAISVKVHGAVETASNWWDGVKTGIKNKIGTVESKIKGAAETSSNWWSGVKTTISNKVSGIATTLGINLPDLSAIKTKITKKLKEIGKKGIAIKLSFSVLASNLKTWIDTNVLSKVRAAMNKTVVLAPFSHMVHLAKGGITNGSTFANIGEAGKEAVIPLERNLGWMDSLSDRLLARMADNGKAMNDDTLMMLYTETNRQNMLIERQNQILNMILEKDTNVEITAASLQKAMHQKNVRDGKTAFSIG